MSGVIASTSNAVGGSVTSTRTSAGNTRAQAGAAAPTDQNGFAPLKENEVELVIKRFWRDTRPRVCVRSDVKNVRGFSFRLLVWPQGSKSSHNHLSAFVEVVPPQNVNSTTTTASSGNDHLQSGDASDVENPRGKRAKVEDSGIGEDDDEYLSSDEDDVEHGMPMVTTNSVKADDDDEEPLEPYPPDWCCPCVYYKISVMNTKHKFPYTKTDTWTFSYVCPDRGWHTLLDTRFVNRRDGYLSSDGTLVIRASVYPRFAHPLSVGPLTRSMAHDSWSRHPMSPEYREALWAVAMMEEEEDGDEEEEGHGEGEEGDAAGGGDGSSSASCTKLGCDCDWAPRPGNFGGALLSNVLATDHINSLLQSLFYIPAVRKAIYSIDTKPGSGPDLDATFKNGIPDLGSEDSEAAAYIEERVDSLQSIEGDLEGVCGDLRLIMELVTGKSEYARVAERELLSSQRRPAVPTAEDRAGGNPSDRGARAARKFEEMERHLLGRFRKSRVVIEQLMEIVDELLSCEKRRMPHPKFGDLQKHQLMLRSVMRKLNKCVDYMLHKQQLLREEIVEYLKKRKGGSDGDGGDKKGHQGDDGGDPEETPPPPPQPCLIRELQLLFARMEMQQDESGFCRICNGANVKDNAKKGSGDIPSESDYPIPCTCQVIDTSGVIKALGLDGPNCSVSPERIYSSFFDKLQKHASLISKTAWERLADLFQGWAVYSASSQDSESRSSAASGRGNHHHAHHHAEDRDSATSSSSAGPTTSEAYSFSHLRFNNGKSSSIEKHLSCWTQNPMSTAEHRNAAGGGGGGGACCGGNAAVDGVTVGGEEDGSGSRRSCQFINIPPILHLQFINKIKERLDISEQLDFTPYMDPVVVEAASQRYQQLSRTGSPTTSRSGEGRKGGSESDDTCERASVSSSGEEDSPAVALSARVDGGRAATSEFRYRLHSVTFCTNVCGATDSEGLGVGHYYVLVRQSRRGRWCRIDDGYREVLQDGFHCTEWVFSPEWACVGLCYVREDQEDRLYERGVDFRHIRPSLYAEVTAGLPKKIGLHKPIHLQCHQLVARDHALHPAAHSPLIYDQLALTQARAEQNGGQSNQDIKAAALAAAASASMQIEVTLVTEGQLTNVDGYYLNGMFPHKGRKFLVRKDIPVERLMKAVEEHFKIPKHMQRLFALRYYADTHQERFELMTPSRMIASYMPSTVQAAAHQAALASQQQQQGTAGKQQQQQKQPLQQQQQQPQQQQQQPVAATPAQQKQQQQQSSRSDRLGHQPNSNTIGHVVVLCMMNRPTSPRQLSKQSSAAQQSPPMVTEEATVWVKFVHPKTLRLISIGLVTLDTRCRLRDYFPAVRAKISSHTPDGATIAEAADSDAEAVEVWEEMNVRQTIKRDVDRTVREERIIDGDILIFMSPGTIQQDSIHEETPAPPAEAALPDTIPPVTAVKRKILVPRTSSLLAATTSGGTLSATQLAATLGAATPGELRVAERYIAEAAAKLDDAMEGLCKEHQRQMAPSRPQAKAAKKAVGEKAAATDATANAEEKANAGSSTAKGKILDSGWHVTRTTGSSVLTGPIGRQLTPEQLIDSASVESIQEHVRRVVQGPRCFKCDMPLGTALHPARVRCSEGCHPERAFHDMCIQNLVRDRQSEDCVYTPGCVGKLICTPRHVISGLVKKDVKLSMNVLKQKFATVLPTPQVMAASGSVSNAPPLPAQIEQAWTGSLAGAAKKGGKRKGGSKKKGGAAAHHNSSNEVTAASIPKDHLWWHACIRAWGSVDELNKWMAAYCASSTVEPNSKAWQQNTVSRAKSIYAQWLLVLETRIAERDRKRALELSTASAGWRHQTVQQPQARKQTKKKKASTTMVSEVLDDDDSSLATSGKAETASMKGSALEESGDEDSDLELIVHSGKYKHSATERAASLLQPLPTVEPPAAAISPTEAAQRSADMAWCAVQSKKKRHQQMMAEQKAKQILEKKAALAAASEAQQRAAKEVQKPAGTAPPASTPARPAKKAPPPTIATMPSPPARKVADDSPEKKKPQVKAKAVEKTPVKAERPEKALPRQVTPQQKQPPVTPPPPPPPPPQLPPVRDLTPGSVVSGSPKLAGLPLPATPAVAAKNRQEGPASAPPATRPKSVTSGGITSDTSPSRSVWEPLPNIEHPSFAPFPNPDPSLWLQGPPSSLPEPVWGPPAAMREAWRGPLLGQQQQPATPSAGSGGGSIRSAQHFMNNASPLTAPCSAFEPRGFDTGAMSESYGMSFDGSNIGGGAAADSSSTTMFQVRVKNLMPAIRRFALPADKLFVSDGEESGVGGAGSCVMVRCPLAVDCEWQRQTLVNLVGGRVIEMYVTPVTNGSGSGPSSATALQWFLQLSSNREAQYVRNWIITHQAAWQVTVGHMTDCSVYGFNPNACPISDPDSPTMRAATYWVFGDDLNDDFTPLSGEEEAR